MYLKKNIFFNYRNIIISASLIPIILFGFLMYNNSKKDITQATFKHIQTINLQKNKLIQDYFQNLEFNMYELTKTISFLERQAKNNIINIQTLQKNNIKDYYYSLHNDISSLSQKEIFLYTYRFLERGKTVSSFYFNKLKEHKKALRIKNILMIDEFGKILYSSDKKNIINTKITNFLHLKRDKNFKKIYYVNFNYEHSPNIYTQFVVTRLKGTQGFIAIEVDQEKLQKIVANVASLGKSAETYLVYKKNHKTYLATNRHAKKGKVGDAKTCIYIERGFTFDGIDIKHGSSGEMELVGFSPIIIDDITFSMQTTVAYTQIISPTIDGADYFQQFVKDYNYHNIMIIGAKGDIYYSVLHGSDYKKNIFNVNYSDTHLSLGVLEVLKTKKYVLTDLDFYPACEKGLAQFALSPILRDDGTVHSVIVVQLKAGYLSKLLTDKQYLYESYETYVVGKNNRLRSNTTLEIDKYNVNASFKKNLKIHTQATQNAFEIGKGIDILLDYRNIKVLSSFSKIESSNIDWAVISKINAQEIEVMLVGLKYNIYLFIFLSSLVALIITFIITNEKNKQDDKLQYNASHDALTDLPNRKLALEFLSYILASNERSQNKLAVLFIDLDNFKFINDSYGHVAGDFVLIEVAKRLTNILRKDDLIARLGGDEFILIVNNFKTNSDLETLCTKLISSVGEVIHDTQRSYQVGISIGIASSPQDSSKAQELLQFADTAMFKTKENGKNGFTYYSKDMTQNSLRISRVERELKHAIKNNELILHFQAQIHLTSSKVIGVEALIRWNHPQDGLIMPDDFIPIAEQSDLIVEIGYWVFREACTVFKSWKENGCRLQYISVNMSTKQLQCVKCVENIKMILNELDFKSQWLELEITENTLISNLQPTLENINILKKMGIKFAIDDFGTGYSSLSYLKSLQISTLKIDREFIKDILTNKDDRIIVEAIILMGHTLNYSIIAEGVQSKEAVILLKYFSCDIVQGNYYSKPLDEEKFLLFIENFTSKDINA